MGAKARNPSPYRKLCEALRKQGYTGPLPENTFGPTRMSPPPPPKKK